jgi:hypothetical protein
MIYDFFMFFFSKSNLEVILCLGFYLSINLSSNTNFQAMFITRVNCPIYM